MSLHKNRKLDIERARSLRRASSPVERKLWKELSAQATTQGLRFRRQHPLSPYIVDFACLEINLVIEIDGASHDATVANDMKREEHLTQMGYHVIRYSNDDVIKDVRAVVSSLLAVANKIREKTAMLPPT